MKRLIFHRSKLLHAGAFFAYLWLARGFSPSTAHKYLNSLERPEFSSHPFAVRHFKEMLADERQPDEPDRKLDIVRDYVLCRGDKITLAELARRTRGLVSVGTVKNDFKWWCWQKGYDPGDFYVAGKGYQLPREFVEWWLCTMLPQYARRRRWVTAEEVKA